MGSEMCIRDRYTTSLWQFGDAQEENGLFKILWYKNKQDLVTYKSNLRKHVAHEVHDSILLVNQCFHTLFGNQANVKKVLYRRDWYPVNRKLLSHPDSLKVFTKMWELYKLPLLFLRVVVKYQ